MDYIKREDVNRILYDLGVSEVYKLPSFWCHGGKDYQVIPTKYHNGYQQALADADEHIKGIPAADVVEVIRCKECRYNVANMEKDPYDITDYTDITCTYFMTDGMSANDFCKWGKKV